MVTKTMKSILRILEVEDSEDDALLILHQIKKGGYDVEYERVCAPEEMKTALKEKTWDMILCDYHMPHFNGLEALKLLKESGIDIPFIIISGTIGDIGIYRSCPQVGSVFQLSLYPGSVSVA